MSIETPLPLEVGPEHIPVEVVAVHGPDWFPMHIGGHGLFVTTLYLRRDELRALRDRLDEIDRALPDPDQKASHERA